MTWGDALENVNFWAALVAALSTLVIGAIWYHKAVFGKDWMRLVGLKDSEMQGPGMKVTFLTSLTFSFLGAVMLSALMYLTDMRSGGYGVLLGAIVGFTAGFGPIATNYAFARRKVELTLLEGGHTLVQFIVMGWIVGIWG